MNEPDLEFVVSEYVAGNPGSHTVIGRCGDRPIRLGDDFNLAFRAKHRRYPDEIGNRLEREAERPVELRVEHIHAYGRCLEMLGQGMTGAIELSGPDAEKIEPGWTLTTERNCKQNLQIVSAVPSSLEKT